MKPFLPSLASLHSLIIFIGKFPDFLMRITQTDHPVAQNDYSPSTNVRTSSQASLDSGIRSNAC